MFQYIHAEVYARKACTNPKNKTKYCIDDIIGEVIRVLAMSARRSNVKVEPPCVARSARTPGSIVTNSTTNDSKESAPSPMLRMGACTKTRARRLRRLFMPSATSNRQVATTRQRGWAAKRSEQRGECRGNPLQAGQGAAPVRQIY